MTARRAPDLGSAGSKNHAEPGRAAAEPRQHADGPRPAGGTGGSGPTQLSRQLALALPPASPGLPVPSGALAATRNGVTGIRPSVFERPAQSEVLAHEAVHRAQFSAFGRLPVGTVSQLEGEAAHGGRRLLDDLSFAPTLAAPPGLTLTYPDQAVPCPGGCHQPSRPAGPDWSKFPDWHNIGTPPTVKSPTEKLADQPKTIPAELERFDQNILAQRTVIFQRLEQNPSRIPSFSFGSVSLSVRKVLPPGLRARYAAMLVASAVIEAGVAAQSLVAEVQDGARGAVLAFYHGLDDLASAYGNEDSARLAQYDQDDKNWVSAHSRAAPCPHCHDEPRQEYPRLEDLRPPRPVLSPVPQTVARSLPQALDRATQAAATTQWQAVLRDLSIALDWMDQLLAGLLSRQDFQEGSGLAYLKAQRRKLAEFGDQHPFALPVPAVFYPENRFVDADQQPDPHVKWQVPEAIPWRFYLYHTGASMSGFTDGEWVLVDMTAPKVPDVRSPATAADAFLFHMKKVRLPKELTGQLDNKYHFSKGKLYFTHPTGDNDSLETTEPRTGSDWLRIIGMTLGAIALVAAVVVTGGAALGLAAPTIATIATVGTAAGIVGAGFNIAGTVADMREKERFGLLTPEEQARGYLSIALDVVGALSMGMGRLAAVAEEGAIALQAGRSVGTVTRALATLEGRSLFLLQRSAQIMKGAALGADFIQAGAMTADFLTALDTIRSQPGLTDSQREAAIAKLVGSSLLTGTLLIISIRASVHDLQRPRVPITLDESNHLTVARPEPGAARPAGAIEPKLKAPSPEPLTSAGPGQGLRPVKSTAPVLDPELPEGRVEVRLVRDSTGKVVDAYTAYHAHADKGSIAIHEQIAGLLREDRAELDLLLHEQAKAYGGADAPVELQLELKKLFDEAALAERRLASGVLGNAAKDVEDKLTLLKKQIGEVRAALADPKLRPGFEPGVVGVPVKPRGMPDPPDGHIYYVRSTGEWDLRVKATGPRPAVQFRLEKVGGKLVATNRAHIESEFAGFKLTPARQAQLEDMGYVFPSSGGIRRAPLRGVKMRGELVPLELDGQGRVLVAEGQESIGEMQARLTASMTKTQTAKLASVRAAGGTGSSVVLVEGVADTGVTWAQILTKTKQAQLRALMTRNKIPNADIDRLIDSLVSKKETLKVVVGTRPVRAAHDYVEGFSEAYGAPRAGAEVHHGDPLYLGGGHGPETLLALRGQAHDEVHAFFDALTLPSGRYAGTALQSGVLQARVSGSLKPAAAVVRADGSVSYEMLGK
jgi:hypothetical protein